MGYLSGVVSGFPGGKSKKNNRNLGFCSSFSAALDKIRIMHEVCSYCSAVAETVRNMIMKMNLKRLCKWKLKKQILNCKTGTMNLAAARAGYFMLSSCWH